RSSGSRHEQGDQGRLAPGAGHDSGAPGRLEDPGFQPQTGLRANDGEAAVRWKLILATALSATAWLAVAGSQEVPQPPKDGQIEREHLSLAGWDPDEPVPAYI